MFKLIKNTRSRLRSVIKCRNISKQKTTIKYLGCSIQFFKRYIEVQFEKDMNWENHGKLWDIDHIIPIAYELSENDILSRFHWSNCQPMRRIYNSSKNNRYISFNDNIPLTKKEYAEYNFARLLLILGRIGMCCIFEYINNEQFNCKNST